MRPVAEVPIPAHGEAVFEPGGYHIMFVDPVGPLVVGDTVELTLELAGVPSADDRRARGGRRADGLVLVALVGTGGPMP